MNIIKLSLVFNHGKCVVHGLVKLATLSPDNAIECVVHGCDVFNKGASLALTGYRSTMF